MNYKTIYLALFSMILILCLISLAYVKHYPILGNKFQSTDSMPTSHALAIHNTHYDTQGNRSMVLTGRNVSTTYGGVTIQHPRLTLIKTGHINWNILADNAQSVYNTNTIELHGNVQLHKKRDETSGSMHIHTHRLTVYLNQHIAVTNQHISLATENTAVEADGMTINLNTNQVSLHAKSRSSFHLNN